MGRLNAQMAIVGEWFQPRPVVFIPGEAPEKLVNEGGNLELVISREKRDGKMKHILTLTDSNDDFTIAGYLNRKFSRVHWDNGAIWARAHKPDAELPSNNMTNDVFQEDPAHEAAPGWGCCSSNYEDEYDDDKGTVCCSVFGGRGRSTGSKAPAPTEPVEKAHLGRIMPVEIISARGLRSADWGTTNDVFCRCEIRDKPGSFAINTPVVKSKEPVWNHIGQLEDYVVGDALVFSLWDKDTLTWKDSLGKVVVTSEMFHPDGFEGELPIEGAGSDEAFLTIDIAPESEITGRKRILSSRQVANIVERCNEHWDSAFLTESMEARVLENAVQTVNRRLRRALLSFCDRGWVNTLQVLLDDEKDVKTKKSLASMCLKDCFRNPLAKALTGLFASVPGIVHNTALRINKVIVHQLVEELIEGAIEGLEEVGLAITVTPDAEGDS